MNKERNICIVGLGLLGGSYAMGLTDAGYTVTAVDVRPEAIRYALEKGIIAAGAVEDFAPLLAGAAPAQVRLGSTGPQAPGVELRLENVETTRSTSSPARCSRMCAA